MTLPISVTGKIVEGHGVASGRSTSSPYPGGSLIRQLPHFEKLNVPLGNFFLGTINVDIAPRAMALIAWDYAARQITWTELIPSEDFFFSHCRIRYEGSTKDAMIYYPSPETKVENFHNPNIVEILAAKIESLRIGDPIELLLNPAHCSVT
ncbi:MAG: hypothetical protein F6K19_41845 [Cyanothece sp. SIO1E1]|nr:hypothetical protein [Cyanothece sp. SIO1E1]